MEEKEILERYFDYVELNDKENMYLETWTNGGVDMIIYLDKNKTIIENLKEYLENFDIDEEIDMYRQDKNYREAFKITESVKDFEQWKKYIKHIIKILKVLE